MSGNVDQDTKTPARNRGRPTFFSPERDYLLTVAVDMVKADARAGQIRRTFSTDKAACAYIASHPDAAAYRENLGLPETVKGSSLAVRLSEARRRLGPLGGGRKKT